MIPIVVLHHNEYDYLCECISSIEKKTKLKKYKIYIVDNNSEENIREKIEKKFGRKYKIFYNKKDNWLKGFNLAIDYIKFKWEYIILTDADIKFKEGKNNKCWLTYLVKEMDKFRFIGKLGLSINTDFIKNKRLFKDIYKRELTYQKGIQIGDNIISPVDTTAAIYRRDLFITENFRMEVGHTSLMKPYYFSCRTGKNIECIHLGWEKYYLHFLKKKQNSIHILRKKAWFFCKWNRPIEKSISKNLPKYEQIILHISSKYFYRVIYSFRFITLWIMYLIKNFPFNYNEIQNKINK